MHITVDFTIAYCNIVSFSNDLFELVHFQMQYLKRMQFKADQFNKYIFNRGFPIGTFSNELFGNVHFQIKYLERMHFQANE